MSCSSNRTEPINKAYDEGWERVFGKKKVSCPHPLTRLERNEVTSTYTCLQCSAVLHASEVTRLLRSQGGIP